jgi:uncharacterized membrane protein
VLQKENKELVENKYISRSKEKEVFMIAKKLEIQVAKLKDEKKLIVNSSSKAKRECEKIRQALGVKMKENKELNQMLQKLTEHMTENVGYIAKNREHRISIEENEDPNK